MWPSYGGMRFFVSKTLILTVMNTKKKKKRQKNTKLQHKLHILLMIPPYIHSFTNSSLRDTEPSACEFQLMHQGPYLLCLARQDWQIGSVSSPWSICQCGGICLPECSRGWQVHWVGGHEKKAGNFNKNAQIISDMWWASYSTNTDWNHTHT